MDGAPTDTQPGLRPPEPRDGPEALNSARPQRLRMPSYMALVDVVDPNPQNLQELASVWGTLRNEVRELDADIVETHAILGAYDFLVLFEAADHDEAFRVAMAIERHGLDTQTMETVPIEEFASIAEDV